MLILAFTIAADLLKLTALDEVLLVMGWGILHAGWQKLKGQQGNSWLGILGAWSGIAAVLWVMVHFHLGQVYSIHHHYSSVTDN